MRPKIMQRETSHRCLRDEAPCEYLPRGRGQPRDSHQSGVPRLGERRELFAVTKARSQTFAGAGSINCTVKSKSAERSR
jgi:hypothetical protein